MTYHLSSDSVNNPLSGNQIHWKWLGLRCSWIEQEVKNHKSVL